MLTCREVAEETSDYIDRSASRARRLAVWTHLRVCPNCRTYLRQFVRSIRLARRAVEKAPPPTAEDELAALFAARGRQAGN